MGEEASRLESQAAIELAELSEVRNNLAGAYSQLAEFYLDETNSSDYRDSVKHLDSSVHRLLKQRDKALADEQQARVETAEQLQTLAKRREQQSLERDRAAEALEKQVVASRETLLKNPEFSEQREQWHSLHEQQQKVVRRLAAAEEDREAKRAPY